MEIKHYKSTNFPKSKIKHLNKLCLPNGNMKDKIIPLIAKDSNANFDVICAYIDGAIVAWAYFGLNVFAESNFGIFVEPSLRQNGIGRKIVDKTLEINKNKPIIIAPHDDASIHFCFQLRSNNVHMINGYIKEYIE
jgi:GNAT superfamily N-acetyltransferase